jgi:uncharacterized protein YndB with AHSA1/START domain
MNAVAIVPTVKVRREIAAPAAELFDAWLDPEKLAAWMRPGDAQRASVKLDPRVGGEFEIVMYTPSGPVPHTGRYQVIERPRRLVFTWNSAYAGQHGSLVTVEFKPAGRGTEIVLTHEKLPNAEMADAHSKGWARILELMAESYAKAA